MEALMTTKTLPTAKPIAVKRKGQGHVPLNSADVRIASKGGDDAFVFYAENGKLPVSK
jgi:hypothetical protein